MRFLPLARLNTRWPPTHRMAARRSSTSLRNINAMEGEHQVQVTTAKTILIIPVYKEHFFFIFFLKVTCMPSLAAVVVVRCIYTNTNRPLFRNPRQPSDWANEDVIELSTFCRQCFATNYLTLPVRGFSTLASFHFPVSCESLQWWGEKKVSGHPWCICDAL